MSNIGIYKITSPSGKVYIGQTWNFVERVKDYKSLYSHKQAKLHASFIKYGVEAHNIQMILGVSENITQQMFDSIEQKYMDYYRSNGYELMNIREAGSRGRHSEETKLKMSLSQKGKKRSPETIENIKISKSNPTPETRQKMSEAGKRWWTQERRLARSAAYKGRPKTEKQILAEKHLKRACYGNHHMARSIIQYDLSGNFVKEWSSLREASESGPSLTNLRRCLCGEVNQASGYVWKYKD